MASTKIILDKVTLPELKQLVKNASTLIVPRIRVLIKIKMVKHIGILKRDLVEAVGVNHNSA